jgi:hypothetical protein
MNDLLHYYFSMKLLKLMMYKCTRITFQSWVLRKTAPPFPKKLLSEDFNINI